MLANIGARYVFYDGPKTGLAVIGGINVPTGNKTISKSVRPSNTIAKAGAGLVFSSYLNNDLSIDVNLQYLGFIEKSVENGRGNWYVNSDLGYYVLSHKLLLIVGLGYQISTYETFNEQVLTLYPGISVETGQHYIIVINSLIDLWGQNIGKNVGIALALNITLD